MKSFFSIDWGTSSLRIRLVNSEKNTPEILYEHSDQNGTGHVFRLWDNEKRNTSQRDFFLQFLQGRLAEFYKYLPTGTPLPPVVISGMASSSIGILELPYSKIPFDLNGDDLTYEVIRKTTDFDHEILLLSGLCCSDDVMRGEETQLLGLHAWHNLFPEALYIFPGTHSKHIYVKKNQVTSFKTYITGELFKLLSEYSVLKNSIQTPEPFNTESFISGLELSGDNLLNSTFKIRARSVLSKKDCTGNQSLLSGLLIGYEINSLKNMDLPIYLCAHENLSHNYTLAIKHLSLEDRCTMVPAKAVDESVVHGQYLMIKKIAL